MRGALRQFLADNADFLTQAASVGSAGVQALLEAFQGGVSEGAYNSLEEALGLDLPFFEFVDLDQDQRLQIGEIVTAIGREVRKEWGAYWDGTGRDAAFGAVLVNALGRAVGLSSRGALVLALASLLRDSLAWDTILEVLDLSTFDLVSLGVIGALAGALRGAGSGLILSTVAALILSGLSWDEIYGLVTDAPFDVIGLSILILLSRAVFASSSRALLANTIGAIILAVLNWEDILEFIREEPFKAIAIGLGIAIALGIRQYLGVRAIQTALVSRVAGAVAAPAFATALRGAIGPIVGAIVAVAVAAAIADAITDYLSDRGGGIAPRSPVPLTGGAPTGTGGPDSFRPPPPAGPGTFLGFQLPIPGADPNARRFRQPPAAATVVVNGDILPHQGFEDRVVEAVGNRRDEVSPLVSSPREAKMTIPNRVIEGQALSRDGVEEQWVTAVREAILELFGGVAGRDITGAVFFGDGVNSVEAVTPPSVSDGKSYFPVVRNGAGGFATPQLLEIGPTAPTDTNVNFWWNTGV